MSNLPDFGKGWPPSAGCEWYSTDPAEITIQSKKNGGNVTLNNDNNVNLHQKVAKSRVGGKFGLGYKNTDLCCIVVRSLRDCDTNQLSTGSRCGRKRHRVCSKNCKSRVMEARRITVCDSNSDYTDSMALTVVMKLWNMYQSNQEDLCAIKNQQMFIHSGMAICILWSAKRVPST